MDLRLIATTLTLAPSSTLASRAGRPVGFSRGSGLRPWPQLVACKLLAHHVAKRAGVRRSDEAIRLLSLSPRT